MVLDALTQPLRWLARRVLTGLAMIALAVAAGGQAAAAAPPPAAGPAAAPVAVAAATPPAERAAPQTSAADRGAVEARHAPHVGYAGQLQHHSGAWDAQALPRTSSAVLPPHDAPYATALGQRAPPRR